MPPPRVPMLALLQAVLPEKYSDDSEATQGLRQVVQQKQHEAKCAKVRNSHRISGIRTTMKSSTVPMRGGMLDSSDMDQVEVSSAIENPKEGYVAHWPSPQQPVSHYLNPYLTEGEMRKRYGTRAQPFQPNHDGAGSEPIVEGEGAAPVRKRRYDPERRAALKEANMLRKVNAVVMEWRGEVHRNQQDDEKEKNTSAEDSDDEDHRVGLQRKATSYFTEMIQGGGLEAMDKSSLEVNENWSLDPAALHQQAMMKLMEEERAIQDNILVSIKTFLNTAGNIERNAAELETAEIPDFRPVLTKRKKRQPKTRRLVMGNEMLMSALPMTAALDIRAKKSSNYRTVDDTKNAAEHLFIDEGDDEDDANAMYKMHPSLERWLNPSFEPVEEEQVIDVADFKRDFGSGDVTKVDSLAVEQQSSDFMDSTTSNPGGATLSELTNSQRKSVAFSLPQAKLPEAAEHHNKASTVPTLPSISKPHQPRPPRGSVSDPSMRHRVGSFAANLATYGMLIENEVTNPAQVNAALEEQLAIITSKTKRLDDPAEASMDGSSSTLKDSSSSLSTSTTRWRQRNKRRPSVKTVKGVEAAPKLTLHAIDWGKIEFPPRTSALLPELYGLLQDACRNEKIAIPAHFLCTITKELMIDPVQVFARPAEGSPSLHKGMTKRFVVVDRSVLEEARRSQKATIAPHLSEPEWSIIQTSTTVAPALDIKKRLLVWRSNVTTILASAQTRHKEALTICREMASEIVEIALTVDDNPFFSGSMSDEETSRSDDELESSERHKKREHTPWPLFRCNFEGIHERMRGKIVSFTYVVKNLKNLRGLYSSAVENSDRVESEFDILMHRALRVVDDEGAADLNERLTDVSEQREQCAALLEKLEGQYQRERRRGREFLVTLEEHNKLILEYNSFLGERQSAWSTRYIASLSSAYSVCQMLVDREFTAKGNYWMLDNTAKFLDIDIDTLVDHSGRYATKLEAEMGELLPQDSVVRVYGMKDPIHEQVNPNAKREAVDPIEAVPLIDLEEATELMEPIHTFNQKLALVDVDATLKAVASPMKSRKSIAVVAREQVEDTANAATTTLRPVGSDRRIPWWHFPPPETAHFGKTNTMDSLEKSHLVPVPPRGGRVAQHKMPNNVRPRMVNMGPYDLQ